MGRKDSELLSNMLTSHKMYLEAEKNFLKTLGTYHKNWLYKYLIMHKEKISVVKKFLNQMV